ncbi:MAG: biotin--[acetyl-CoA-carboxylase] ligase, partial [Proteobacteria bacterium]|nr:biotin--[acetyl-CoA-carboxylase] ligase [Pseudomonadota bacterium]
MIAQNHKTAGPAMALEPLDTDSIRDFLTKQGVNHQYRIDVLPTVTSTNDYLTELGLSGTGCVAVCIADQQTQGKGRFGHSWWSPAGVNLYLSMQWGLQQWKAKYEVLGLWLLIAIAQLLEGLGITGVRLKWPNDICVAGKKLGGILIARKAPSTQQSLIFGVGLNVA